MDIDPDHFQAPIGLVSSNFIRQRLPRTTVGKRNLPLTTIASTRAWTTNDSEAFWQGISDELAAGTISGTVKGQIRAMVDATGGNIRLNYSLGLCNRDGSNNRVLLTGDEVTYASGLTTTLTNRKLFYDGPKTIPSTTVNDGDRLMMLISVYKSGTNGTYTVTLDVGDPSATGDLPEDETTTTALCPWIEFSQDLVFKTDPSLFRDTWDIVRVGFPVYGWPSSIENKWAGGGGGAATDQYNQVVDADFEESRVGEYKVRAGDQYGGASGETCRHRWDNSSEDRLDGGGERWYAWSSKFVGPWTNPTSYGLFLEWHGVSGVIQAPIKFMTAYTNQGAGNSIAKLFLYLNTGGVDGSNNTVIDQAYLLVDHLDLDVRHDFIVRIKFDSNKANLGVLAGATGEVDIYHRLASASSFDHVLTLRNIPTLQCTAGVTEKVARTLIGWYRNNMAQTDIVRHGVFRAGPTIDSVLQPTPGAAAWPDPTTAVTHRVATPDTTDGTSYVSDSFTPEAGELLVAFVVASGTTAAGSMSDSQSLGFTQITRATKNGGLDTIYCFVANTLAEATAMTVTFNCTGDASTGVVTMVAGVSGISRTGAAAVLQSAVQNNQNPGTTPAPAFAASAQSGNPTLGVIGNLINPANLTPPASWIERSDTGHATPQNGAEYVSRDSGFSGTTITWGSTSTTTFGAIIIELDTTALVVSPLRKPLVVSQAVPRSYNW
jgi:hypothetical protein